MNKSYLKFCIFLLGWGAINTNAEESRFYDRGEEGWFFYQVEKEKQEEEPQPKSRDPFLSVAWIKRNLDHYKNLAIDDPSEQNIKAYLYLQRIILEKSSLFATRFQEVVMGDPFLDAISTRPLATWGSNLVDQESLRSREQILKELNNRIGFLYIFSSKDYAHAHFARLFKSWCEQFGYSYKIVSLDLNYDPSQTFQRVLLDPNAERVFNIKVTPAIFAVTLEGKFVPLVQGLISQDELSKRMILLAHRLNLITEDQFLSTRAIYQNIELKENFKQSLDLGEEDFIEPSLLLKLLESK